MMGKMRYQDENQSKIQNKYHKLRMKMMKKVVLVCSFLLLVTGCAAGLNDGQGSYRGKGRVASIMVNEAGDSEISVETEDRGHIPVIVPGNVDIFPGQMVKVERNSRGFGKVDAL